MVYTALLDFVKQNSDASTVQNTCKRVLHNKVIPVVRGRAMTAAMHAKYC